MPHTMVIIETKQSHEGITEEAAVNFVGGEGGRAEHKAWSHHSHGYDVLHVRWTP